MDKARHRPHTHLFHDAGAMNFHGLLHDMQIARYLLVQAAADDVQHDLTFAMRQASPLPRQFCDVLAFPECLHVGQDCGIDRVEQNIFRNGFDES
jgi:hypothetical protein